MSKRLASFQGPSIPSPSPVYLKQPHSLSSRQTETTYHRKLRTLLQQLRAIAQTWDELVLIDGLKAVRNLIDTRTDLENALRRLPDGKPRTFLATPKVSIMEDRIADLVIVISKLRKQFQKMDAVVTSMEALLTEAHKMKGWKWVQDEPLWVTWPLAKFVLSIPDILIPYHRSLDAHTHLYENLRSHSISFEASQVALQEWAAQDDLQEGGWNAQWEDLCAVEVDRWNDTS